MGLMIIFGCEKKSMAYNSFNIFVRLVLDPCNKCSLRPQFSFTLLHTHQDQQVSTVSETHVPGQYTCQLSLINTYLPHQ